MVAIAEESAIDLTQVRCISPPGAKQEDFVFDRRRRVAWIGGRGCSKSASGTFKAIDYVLEWEGARGIVLAPSYSQLQRGTMMTFAEWFPPEWVLKKNMSQDKMYWDILPPGHKKPGRIYFSNANNPDAFRSAEVAWVWMDEAADCKESVYKVIIACLRQKVPADLREKLNRKHYPYQLWLTGTPRGQNWIYKRFVMKADPKRVGFYSARSMDNPFLPESYEELAEEYVPGTAWYQQEIEGKFVDFEGLVYPSFDPEVHVQPLPSNIQFRKVVGGLDLGYGAGVTSSHLMGTDMSGRRWIFKELYQRRAPLNHVMSVLVRWRDEWHVRPFFVDPRANIELRTLAAAGIPAVKADARSIETGVRLITSLLEVKPFGPGLYVTPDCPGGISEILSYCHEHGADAETYSESIKKKQADDAMDEWRYMVVGDMARQPGHNIKQIIFR